MNAKPDLGDDLDLSNPDSFSAGFPHAHFRRLRADDPVHWHEGDIHGGPGYWVVSRYDDLKWVSKNPRLFASGQGNLIEQPPPGELEIARSMITMDPPDHPRFRMLVSGGFTPRHVAAHEDRVREIVREILDAVAEEEICFLAEKSEEFSNVQ